MAKNSRAKWVGIGLTVLTILVMVVASFVWAQADIAAVDTKADDIKEDMGMLKEEGCLPARKSDRSIVKIETQLESIGTRLDTINTQQSQGFMAIMKKLEE